MIAFQCVLMRLCGVHLQPPRISKIVKENSNQPNCAVVQIETICSRLMTSVMMHLRDFFFPTGLSALEQKIHQISKWDMLHQVHVCERHKLRNSLDQNQDKLPNHP